MLHAWTVSLDGRLLVLAGLLLRHDPNLDHLFLSGFAHSYCVRCATELWAIKKLHEKGGWLGPIKDHVPYLGAGRREREGVGERPQWVTGGLVIQRGEALPPPSSRHVGG
ncbi:hypothetical protein D3C76_821630 [compost metagenome]